MPIERLSMDLDTWPAGDRLRWSAAIAPRTLFGGRARAARLSVATLDSYEQAHGAWLHFLAQRGWLEESLTPCMRASGERLGEYIDDLYTRVGSASVASYMKSLSAALRLMEPDGDREVVRDAVRWAEELAAPSRNHLHKLVSPDAFFTAAKARMDRHILQLGEDLEATLTFQDGLQMGFLVSKPVRKGAFAAFNLGTNLNQSVNGTFELKGSVGKTRKSRSFRIDLPDSLAPYTQAWLTKGRPFLLAGRQSKALWLTASGARMTSAGFYGRFRSATEQEFDFAMHPHLIRSIVTTGIIYADPELAEVAVEMLDHEDTRMIEKVYDLSRRVSAASKFVDLIEKRRARALARRGGKSSG